MEWPLDRECCRECAPRTPRRSLRGDPACGGGRDGWAAWVGCGEIQASPSSGGPVPGFWDVGGTSRCHPRGPGGDTRQEKAAAVARCEEAERERFGLWGSEGVPLYRGGLSTWISLGNGREGPDTPIKGPALTRQAAPGVLWFLPGHLSKDPPKCPTSLGWGLRPPSQGHPPGQRVRTILSWMLGDAGKWYAYIPAGTGRLSPR